MPSRSSPTVLSKLTCFQTHKALGPALLLALFVSLGASPPEATQVMGAKDSKVYHTHCNKCPAARRISTDNVVHFASVGEAEQAGRRLCKTCAKIEEDEQRPKTREEAGKDKPDGGSGESSRKKGTDDEGSGSGGEEPSGGTSDHDTSLPEFVKTREILPGGTLELDDGGKAVLIGIICPPEGLPGAEDAARFIKEQTQGRRLRLSRDAQTGPAGIHDSLGRLLAYVTPEPDGRDVGSELVFQGYAWIDRDARFERRVEYARREEEAWHAQRGIWKPLEGEAGKAKVVAGRHALYYHAPDCPHVAHLTGRITLTINEAKARRLPPCSLYGVKVPEDKQEKKIHRQKPSG